MSRPTWKLSMRLLPMPLGACAKPLTSSYGLQPELNLHFLLLVMSVRRNRLRAETQILWRTRPMPTDPLSPEHRRALEKAGDHFSTGNGTVTNKKGLAGLGFSPVQCRVPGQLIPLRAPDGTPGIGTSTPRGTVTPP